MSRFLIIGTVALVAGTICLSAQAQQPAASGSRSVTRPAVPRVAGAVLPGTRQSAFATIQGNALNSVNGPLPNNVVRLRDARFGRIVDTQTTDRSGLFTFQNVDPGSYIVELMGNDQTVLAAGQVLNVNAGDAASTLVKLPFRIPPFARVLGHSAPQAATVLSAAAAAGVLATKVTGDAVSPR